MRCNGGVEKPEVQVEMIKGFGIQGFSLLLLPFFFVTFFLGKQKKVKAKQLSTGL